MSEPKYQTLFEELKTDILSGRYGHGEKMPSEAALVHKTGMSRITVARAFRELQNAGLVERIAGSGSFAKGAGALTDKAYLFGLLIPELGETEIFSHICRAIASAPRAKSHALLWGNPGIGTVVAKVHNDRRWKEEPEQDVSLFCSVNLNRNLHRKWPLDDKGRSDPKA